MFTHFSEERMTMWQISVTVSKFNAYLPHITGCFHLHCAVASLANVDVNVR